MGLMSELPLSNEKEHNHYSRKIVLNYLLRVLPTFNLRTLAQILMWHLSYNVEIMRDWEFGEPCIVINKEHDPFVKKLSEMAIQDLLEKGK